MDICEEAFGSGICRAPLSNGAIFVRSFGRFFPFGVAAAEFAFRDFAIKRTGMDYQSSP
jgi:hypothetical protein